MFIWPSMSYSFTFSFLFSFLICLLFVLLGWKHSVSRKFFNDYAEYHSFNPLNPENWYSQSIPEILAFKVIINCFVIPSLPNYYFYYNT